MYVTAFVDQEKCIGCKLCIQACPEPNVIDFIVETKKVVVIASKCKGCGLCEGVCPKNAITLSVRSLISA